MTTTHSMTSSQSMTTATRTVPLSGQINLLVRTGSGSVHVETADDLDEATVRLDGPPDQLEQVQVDLRGRTLTVLGPRPAGLLDVGLLVGRFGAAGVDIQVRVPTATAIKIMTTTAPIRVSGTVSGADLTFGRATADVEHVLGDVRIRFASGTATIERADGAVAIRSGAGTAQLGRVGGELSVGSGTGEVCARVVHGRTHVRSGSGSTVLEQVHGDVDVASGAGSVQVGLPAGVAARLDIRSASGTARCELPVEDVPRPGTAAIGVRARTGHGDVRIYRAETEPAPAADAP